MAIDAVRGPARRRPLRWLAAAVLLAGVGLSAPPIARAEEDDAEIALTEPITIEEFLRAVGKATKKPLIWTEKIGTQKIVGAQTLKAPRSKLFDLVRALLTFYELGVIAIGPRDYEVYLVINVKDQLGSLVRLKPQYVELTDENLGEYEQRDGLFIATSIKVKNVENMAQARQALTKILTLNVSTVQEVTAARTFILADFAPNVVAAYRLLRQMDIEPEGKKIKQLYITLQNALAQDIEPILTDLFTGRQRITQQVPGQQGAVDLQDPEPRIVVDARTNQIIVYGIEDDLKEIAALVDHLDTSITIPRTYVHVIRLRNLKAVDIADVLSRLVEGTTLFGGAASGGGTTQRRTGGLAPRTQPTGRVPPPGTAGGGPVALPPELQEKPVVVAEESSNSIIVAGSREQYEQIKSIIDEIDIRKSQVLIEAAVVELSLDDSYKLAVEIAGLDDNGLNSDGSASPFGGTSFGLTKFYDRDGDGIFTDRFPQFVGEGGAAPTGLIGGIFASGQVPLIYSALNTTKKTRVVQLPSIVTSDNEESIIKVLDNQATTQNTVTTGGNTSAGFGDFVSAGTTLEISPHIAHDTYLLLNINLKVSGFKGQPRIVNGAQVPADTFERQIITAVTVPDRHTVVLGGLIGTTRRETADKVPLLGDIPILGELFKSTDKVEVQTNLFLFVTPTILPAMDVDFALYDKVTCDRKQKADELVGEIDIPFSNFKGCRERCIDKATGCVRGSGSTSERLDRLGVLEATRFGRVDASRLAAEAQAAAAARRRALEQGAPPTPPRSGAR